MAPTERASRGGWNQSMKLGLLVYTANESEVKAIAHVLMLRSVQ
jgi:hypothetical protein